MSYPVKYVRARGRDSRRLRGVYYTVSRVAVFPVSGRGFMTHMKQFSRFTAYMKLRN